MAESSPVETAIRLPPAEAARYLRARAEAARPPPQSAPAADPAEVRCLDRWRRRHSFWCRRVEQQLRFIIPDGQSVLMYGCEDGSLLTALRPSRGVGIERSHPLTACAARRHPRWEYHGVRSFLWQSKEKFDYLVVNYVADEVGDVAEFLECLAPMCTPATRLVIVQNHDRRMSWRRWVRRFGLRGMRFESDSLHVKDLQAIVASAGFEVLERTPKLFSRRRWLGLGTALNGLAGLFRSVGGLAGVHFLVARIAPRPSDAERKTASIVMVMRNERDNVGPLIQTIPALGAWSEIVIVEGGSTDGTRSEIERVQRGYPEKNVRLVVQSGEGIANAILEGFLVARGDVIVLLEADRTTPASDVRKVFDLIASGRAEFVNGTRFVYPRETGAMRPINALGNRFFAGWFSWLHGGRSTDLLCGLKGIDRQQFRRLVRQWGFLDMDDPFSDFELALGASRLGLKIAEVPTRYSRRSYGETKIRVFADGWRLLRLAGRATRVFRCR